MDQSIAKILTPDPLTVCASASMLQCIETMRKHRISCLIVTEGNKPVGIYTEADMVRTISKSRNFHDFIIRELMSSPVITANININVFECTYILTVNKIRHLVIVDDEGDLVGVITQTDIIAHYGADYFLGVKSVSSVMTKHILTVSKNWVLSDAIREMEHYIAGCAIAISDGKPVGILTERDIATLIVNGCDIDQLTMAEVMTAPVITVTSDTTTYEAVNMMNQRKVRRVIVVDNDGILVGILIQENIIRDLEGNYIDFLKQVLWDKDRNLEKAKARFKEQSIHLENILHSRLSMAIVATDLDFNVSYINEDAKKMYNINEDELINGAINNIISLDDRRHKTFPEIRRAIKEHGDFWFSHTRPSAHGSRQLESRITVIKDDDGNVVGFTLLSTDITERLKSDENLLLASHVYESAIEGIMVTDADAIIQSVNPAFTTITGYSAEEVIGKNPRVLQSNRQPKEFYSKMWKAIQKTGRWQGEIWNRRKNGETFPQRLTISSVTDLKGNITQLIGIFYDITEVKAKEELMQRQAYHDPLTDLPNRSLFKDRLNHAIVRARRNDIKLSVLFIDIDNFKNLNDSLGHYAGDLFLQKISKQIRTCLREEDTVSRFGGDEFTVFMEDNNGAEEALKVAEKILGLFRKAIIIDNKEIFLGASIGVANYPNDGVNTDTLIKNADAAMYYAKKKGRNSIQFFQSEMADRIKKRISLETDLRKALNNEEFYIHYQPIIDLHSNTITSLEALLRWKNLDIELLPDQFIPLAEESGLIVPIGEWVMRRSCNQMSEWIKDDGVRDISVSVNLSARQFRETELIYNIEKILEETQLNPEQLHIEITESIMMDNMNYSIETLKRFKKMGIRIYLDDFGTGYSSLTYLKKLPVDALKLDHSFIHGIIGDPDATKLASNVISMAKDLRLEVIAEGVENQEQLDFLKTTGCDRIQGFLFHKPLSEDEIRRTLLQNEHKKGIYN